MLGYLARRLALLVPVLLGLSLIVFSTMALIPGDPALAILGPYATPESIAKLKAELGLDRSLVEQYAIWLANLAQGDLGRSYSLNRPVAAEIAERLGPTFLLAGASLAIALVLGLGAGVIAAVRQGGWVDRAVSLVMLVGISTPTFWLGLMLILLFAVTLGWLPVSGMSTIYGESGALDLARHLLLPALTLALVAAGILARLMRTQMLEVLRQDYIRQARASGLTEAAVIWKHALKNALVAMVPVIAIQIGFLLGGAVYVETVFQWPGIGRMLVDAIATRDLLLVQGGVLVVAASYVVLNLLADLLQQALDPRIRA